MMENNIPLSKESKTKIWRKQYYNRNKEYLKAFTKRWAAKNPEANNQIHIRHKRKLKFKAHSLFGYKCSICRETMHQCLTIDHINGDGKIGKTNRDKQIFRSLLKGKVNPRDYQLLCMNCNHRKYKLWRETLEFKDSEAVRSSFRAMKMRIINIYGGKCYCCENDDYYSLELDHHLYPGWIDRKVSKIDTRTLYKMILNGTRSKDLYRLACSNCNFSAKDSGICGHKLLPMVVS